MEFNRVKASSRNGDEHSSAGEGQVNNDKTD